MLIVESNPAGRSALLLVRYLALVQIPLNQPFPRQHPAAHCARYWLQQSVFRCCHSSGRASEHTPRKELSRHNHIACR